MGVFFHLFSPLSAVVRKESSSHGQRICRFNCRIKSNLPCCLKMEARKADSWHWRRGRNGCQPSWSSQRLWCWQLWVNGSDMAAKVDTLRGFTPVRPLVRWTLSNSQWGESRQEIVDDRRDNSGSDRQRRQIHS